MLREVPPESSFAEAIDAVKSRVGRPHAKGAVDHTKTFAKLIWCVREGKRRLDRRFMSTASSIALHQDAAGKRLLMNFRAANCKLESQSGLLGHCHHLVFGSGTEAVIAGTKQIIRSFCTPFDGAPCVTSAKRARVDRCRVVDTDLEQRIRNAVEVFDTDAAADEYLAGKALKNRVLAEDSSYFPNLKINKKDYTHAAGCLAVQLCV